LLNRHPKSVAVKSKRIIAADIESLILELRGRKVIFDAALVSIYGVETKNFHKSDEAHLKRFPEDFVFQLTAAEALKFQALSAEGYARAGCNLLPWSRNWRSFGHSRSSYCGCSNASCASWVPPEPPGPEEPSKSDFTSEKASFRIARERSRYQSGKASAEMIKLVKSVTSVECLQKDCLSGHHRLRF
jgi:hypothetical protein